ncbi:hypothetical protein MTYP_03088 [Methylophilaceae bacterium]|nr:hypothetical protein MTYP_03088 [Methylophilaceae bacterium]
MDALTKAKQQLNLYDGWMAEKVSPLAATSCPLKLAEWQRELELIRGQIRRPDRVRIALIGSTGAGKSTFLNAVLGQEVLPVGVMQPCTAFVTLVRQSATPGFTVGVDFCSRAEWSAEVDTFAAFLNPGDDDQGQGDGESKRLIESAKKRLHAVLGTQVLQVSSRDGLLALPLPGEAEQIFSDASTQSRHFDSAAEMLDYLRKLIRGESTLWPLVKQVSISGPYDCLAGGLELVDLPGLNDPNAARVEVTREFLRTSPFVWVMFPMVRGLTQDIQTILAEEKLLRTLVFAGTYSALSLIGTKADDVDTNIAPQLGLDNDCETAELIREYRRQTEIAAREQLVQMVRDLATPGDAGDTLDRMLNLASNVSVHTTSASAYMKIRGIGRLRKDYGLDQAEDTGIPSVHEHLAKIAREAGAEFNASMALKRLDQLGAEIAFFFRAAAKAATPDAQQVRQRIEEELSKFAAGLSAAQSEAQTKLEIYREGFLRRVNPLMLASVQGVKRACSSWGGIHWATVRAIVQRDGVFKSPTTGKFYDFNGDLTEPLMSQLPVTWEHYFTDDLGRVTDVFVTSVTQKGTDFCERVRLIIDLIFHRKDELMEQQLAWFQNKVKLLAQASHARLMAAVTQRRSELAVKIPLVARKYMTPAYGDAKAEVGPGMKNRILETLSATAVKSSPPIYDTIQTDLLEGLRDLDAVILGLFAELMGAASDQAKTVAHNAGIDIDHATIDPATKDLLDSIPLTSKYCESLIHEFV